MWVPGSFFGQMGRICGRLLRWAWSPILLVGLKLVLPRDPSADPGNLIGEVQIDFMVFLVHC